MKHEMTHETTQDRPATSGRFGRRTFIAGTTAVGLLAACGGDSDDGSEFDDSDTDDSRTDDSQNDGSGGGDSAGSSSGTDGEYSLIQRYPSNMPVLVPGEVRLPFSLNKDAEFVIDGPETLGAQIVDIDGEPIGDRISAVRRDVTPAPYYAFTPQIDAPGIYGIVIDGGPSTGANFQVVEADQVSIPVPGETLAGFDTPTIEEPAGVDPICTREPNCEFHSLTLAEALTTGSPVAYFVGTPAFCATGSCTPALEALIEVQPDFSDVVFVHAEVYTDLTATDLTPAVQELSLLFEPTVFLIDADGVIVDRIDGLWDTTELRERFQALAT
jgi:hypothetical protein